MRILIAEDDPVSRKMLQGTLTRWGFEVLVCVDGKEALAGLRSPQSPEIAILDWMMPEIDGPEVCRRIRQADSTFPRYIILLTAKTQREDLIAGLQSGADDYVTKPFDPKELRARLNVGIRIINLQKELSEKVAALEVAMFRLGQQQHGQKLEAIGRLASGVAHEINTPMQYIGDNLRFLQESWQTLKPFLEMLTALPGQLRSGADPAELAQRMDSASRDSEYQYAMTEVPKAMDQSLEGVERVSRIVRAMRDFANPSDEHKMPVDLNRAIQATITVARNEWKYVANLESHFDPDLPLVICFAAEIQQVMLDLILNAVHAISHVAGGIGGYGTIAVYTFLKMGWVEIRVSDTGCGIPQELRDKVFEPFFTTKNLGEGTGHGLAIARSVIVQQHYGDFWFESEPGKGTTFFIRLPLDGKRDEDHEHTAESESTARR